MKCLINASCETNHSVNTQQPISLQHIVYTNSHRYHMWIVGRVCVCANKSYFKLVIQPHIEFDPFAHRLHLTKGYLFHWYRNVFALCVRRVSNWSRDKWMVNIHTRHTRHHITSCGARAHRTLTRNFTPVFTSHQYHRELPLPRHCHVVGETFTCHTRTQYPIYSQSTRKNVPNYCYTERAV